MKLPVLPVYYYLDHFEEMLVFVGKTYGGILTAEHHEFIGRFTGFSRDARCLLIRMINRRGAIFNRALFKYAEISDVESALAELSASRQARQLENDDYASFLTCLPKDALLAGAKAAALTDVRSSWPKPKLIEYFLRRPVRDGVRALRWRSVRRSRKHAAGRIPALSLFREDRGQSQELRAARSRHPSHEQGFIVYCLEAVREGGGNEGREEDVVAGAADAPVLSSSVEPPADGEGAEHVFVGSPRHDFRNAFSRPSRASSDTICYRNVCSSGLYPKECHVITPNQDSKVRAHRSQTVHARAQLFGFVTHGLEFGGERDIVFYRVSRGKLLQRLVNILQSAQRALQR